ncbi:MAG: YicC/YloC family endoribonuclease [Gammaproteobacteria bacterium]
MNNKNKIHSMTAFARLSEHSAFGTLTWEIRAVNHRYLDLNIRIPDRFGFLEQNAREILRQQLQRGRIDCYLRYQADQKSNAELTVDENLVEGVIKTLNSISKKISTPTSIDPVSILNLPHVLQEKEVNEEEFSLQASLLLKKTVHELAKSREREGKALRLVLERSLGLVEQEISRIRENFPLAVSNEKQRIVEKLAEIKTELDSSRFEQEMIFFAHKIDILEEIDRLTIHTQDFQRILEEGGSVGKRLDFLLQEMHRETNTMASKSTSVAITQATIELKVLLEQMREQIQNLE